MDRGVGNLFEHLVNVISCCQRCIVGVVVGEEMEHFGPELHVSPTEMPAKPGIKGLSCLRVYEVLGTHLAFLSFPCLPFLKSPFRTDKMIPLTHPLMIAQERKIPRAPELQN